MTFTMNNNLKPTKNNLGATNTRKNGVFTPENCKKCLDGFAKGLPMRIVAQRAGIMERTLRDWIENGHREEEDFELGHLGYQTEKAFFYVEAKRHTAIWTARQLGLIQKAAEDPMFWKAAAHLLATSDNELFGRKSTVTLDSTQKKEITVRFVSEGEWKGETLEADLVESVPRIASGDDDSVEGAFADENDESSEDDEEDNKDPGDE